VVATTAETTSLKGLIEMTELDIREMSDESVKQMLMDLRGLPFVRDLSLIHLFRGLDQMSNERIARLGREEAVRTLLDLRDIARRR